MARSSMMPARKNYVMNASARQRLALQSRFDLTVVQRLPDEGQYPNPILESESPIPNAISSHFTISVPNPFSIILSSVRHALGWTPYPNAQMLPTTSKRSTVVTSEMGAQEVLKCLVEHGCPDVSSNLSPVTASPTPWAGGSFGDIYKWQTKNGLTISVKCLRFYANSQSNRKSTKRASRELYNWSKVRHPNVLELKGVALFHGQIAMVAPWMENGNLRRFVKSQPDADRWDLCIQVAEGLSHIHAIKMAHGDLKAENILISDEGTVKIGDFGNSILEECSLRHTATTNLGGGTIRWMAWELFQHSDPPVDRSPITDVHSLGMTILEVMTGEDPYAEYKNTPMVIRALDRKQLPIRPKEFAPHTLRGDERWQLLLDCWNLTPSLRPRCSEVLDAMKELRWDWSS